MGIHENFIILTLFSISIIKVGAVYGVIDKIVIDFNQLHDPKMKKLLLLLLL